MSSLTGDETAEPVPRDQIVRREQEFRLVVEIEHPETGRDGRTCLARPNSQARTGHQTERGEYARRRGTGRPNLSREIKLSAANGDSG